MSWDLHSAGAPLRALRACSELAKSYDHRDVEERWYARWLAGGYFGADAGDDRPPFTIVIPPPNVTGSLHMGHALTLVIQDVLIRWKRMAGHNALWVPGTDHAGIATQMVVERLLAQEGTSRKELGREKFVERCWQWKEACHGRITKQTQALGASVDWTRERFTLDAGLSRAVREVFVTLYEQGLIYRDYRLVNWSPGCQTVISDLEVVYDERVASLWHVAYPVKGSDERLVVATTRPETMLGDTAVAVHPDDPRYRHLIGRQVELPLTNRKIPIIADAILVDMEFGTGAVKVTPAHDPNDFETGKRHGLQMISVIDAGAKLNANAPEKYRGMDRYDAREAVLADLEKIGLLVKTEPYRLKVGTCQRSGVVVEPMLSEQWYVRVAPLAGPAADAVRDGRTRIVPPSWEKTYFHWLDNIRDWCISRQLWWGHRVPAWYCGACDHVTVAREDPSKCGGCGGTDLRQDEDVLDTWFSSGLWPFSTLGWPDETADLKTFYPTSVMETGFDILFFWVARMMMMGLHFMGDVPFRSVYLHAMVRDEHGQKMSKTKGNVLDPLDVSKDFGADSLRYTLASLAGAVQDIKLGLKSVESNRNFVNKIWNACRFALMNLGDYDPHAGRPSELSVVDRWMLARLEATIIEVTDHLEGFRIDEAARRLYVFFWSELCDWYIELCKPVLYEDGAPGARRAAQWTLVRVLDQALRLLHPIIPFCSEEIWRMLPLGDDRPEVLMIAPYPKPGDNPRDLAAEAEVGLVMDAILALRNIRGELRLGGKIGAIMHAKDAETAAGLERARAIIERLARVDPLEISVGGERPRGSAMQLAGATEVFVPLAGLIDLRGELERLEKEASRAEQALAGITKKLSNSSFVDRAPQDVVQKERDRRDELNEKLAKLADSRARLEALAD